MATCVAVALALVLTGNVVLALSGTGRRRMVAALCISALAGLELGVGYGQPDGDSGLRRIAGSTTAVALLSFLGALCIGVVQTVGVLVRRQTTERNALAPLLMVAMMPGALYCGVLLGVAVRGHLLKL